jgi:inorganic triphosphatase YgiF
MTDRPVELELKYRVVDPEVAARVLADDTLGAYRATGPARTTQNEDHYVDTPDAALARAGFAARFRQSGGSTLISLKSLHRAVGALHRRDELEGPADRGLVPMDWPASPARSQP